MHQLHPDPALHRGLVPQVPPRRVHRGGGPHARVPVREGGLQRPAGDRRLRPHLSGRPGQRLRHLDRLPQPVLAGGLPDRRPGQGPARALRRGLLRRRPSGAIRSLLAEAGGRTARSAVANVRSQSARSARHPRVLPRRREGGPVRERPDPPRHPELSGRCRPAGSAPTSSPTAASGRSAASRRPPATTPASRSTSTRAGCFCVLGSPGQAAHDAGAARRPADPGLARRARTSTAASRRSPPSASTAWSTCRTPGDTC